MNSQLFIKGKRGGAVASTIFLVIFFTLFSLLGSVFLSVGVGNPVNKATSSLLSSPTFKSDAGQYFVSKALQTATGDERALLLKMGAQISGTVTNLLSNPILQQYLNQISDVAYRYYLTNAKNSQSIDVRPLLQLALLGFESVDPQFSKLDNELAKIKPIKLVPQKYGRKLFQIKSTLLLALLALFLLSLISFFIYLRFAKTWKGVFKTSGIILLIEGVLLVCVNAIAKTIVNQQVKSVSNSLAREAIPTVAQSFLSTLMNVGLVELIVGLILLLLSYIKSLERVDVHG